MSARNNRPIGEKFLPAFFVEITEKGQNFGRGDWPAHITLFPPIDEAYSDTYTEVFRQALNHVPAFDVVVGEDRLFGPDEDVPVRVIVPSDALRAVHQELVLVCGMLLHDPTYRRPYNPHISHPEHFGIKSGQPIHIGGFCVAVCFGGSWNIVEKIGFKG